MFKFTNGKTSGNWRLIWENLKSCTLVRESKDRLLSKMERDCQGVQRDLVHESQNSNRHVQQVVKKANCILVFFTEVGVHKQGGFVAIVQVC